MQPILNLALAAGYILGVILVWIGIEMYALDGARFFPSLLSVVTGIGVWWLLASIGRRMRPSRPAAAEGV
jgi:hypothetical protein